MQWTGYDRRAVRGDLEEASGRALPVSDPLPDMLIAAAQAEGVSPRILRIWIYGAEVWSVEVFSQFTASETVRGAQAAMREARP